MHLDPEILATLRCPVEGTPLRFASRRDLERLNRELAEETLVRADGARVPVPLQDALAAVGGSSAYPVVDGVPTLLPGARLVHAGSSAALGPAAAGCAEDPWAGRWEDLARRWDELRPPVRPARADTAILERVAAERCGAGGGRPRRALLLGVTPETATMRWPEGCRLLAIDSSEAMVRHVWPARDVPHGAAALADWLAMPLRDGSYDLVVGDGSLSLPRYPGGCAATVREIRRVLSDRGVLAMRMFTRPDANESVEAIFADLAAGRIGTLDAAKWRLVMALHADTATGARMGDVWEAWTAHVPDPAALMRSLGWPEDAPRIFEGLQGLDARATFPTLAEVRALLADGFREVGCLRPGYADGDQYPTMVFEVRTPGR